MINKSLSDTEEKFRPCSFCGTILSKEAENSLVSFCDNTKCPFSEISIYDSALDSAYCWKLLDEKEREIKSLELRLSVVQETNDRISRQEREIEELVVEAKEAKNLLGHLIKFLKFQRSGKEFYPNRESGEGCISKLECLISRHSAKNSEEKK